MILLLIIPGFLISCAYPGAMSDEAEYSFNPMRSAIKFYQGPLNHLSAVKHAECPMYPSCSEYSIQCFERHGLFIGWLMTYDRLMRCGRDELKLSQQAIVDGKWKCIDSVGSNDFWWQEE